MAPETPITAVQRYWTTRRLRRRLGLALFALAALLVAAVAVSAVYLVVVLGSDRTVYFADDVAHFKFGSIGSEPASGIPYKMWRALPGLFPEAFEGRDDYSAFGFLYDETRGGKGRDLPIGVSLRRYRGVDVVWLNCAVCHTGTFRLAADAEPSIVVGMPANNFDLGRFVAFILSTAADPRLGPETLIPAIARSAAPLSPVGELFWRGFVLPQVREGLIDRRAALLPLLQVQPRWGPGRVDTFNPYKRIEFDVPLDCGRGRECIEPDERIGTADFPSIFLQAPREGMNLHWDGNNASLRERNLSAAIGAGVTEQTAEHGAIERVAEWLRDLAPPPSPHRPDRALVYAGRKTYMRICAECHGYQDGDVYRFTGERLGGITPIDRIGTDRWRFDSYTEALAERQRSLFEDQPKYRFKYFRKTDGYANAPLDGLWLRAPYLHNGSVPTLADLLEPPSERPAAFVRGLDVIDFRRGGFVAPPCIPGEAPERGICFDTTRDGNGNGGHLYGTDLDPERKRELLAYLLTF